MFVKYQTDSDIFQDINRVTDELDKRLERVKYLKALKTCKISEGYRDGKLSLIFDMPISLGQINSVWPRTSGDPSCSSDGFSCFFIFESDAADSGNGNHGDQEQVLIRNVQCVKGEDVIVPSRVRLYIGENPFVEPRAESVYFSPFKGVFHSLSGFAEGKLGKIIQRCGKEFLDCSNPRVIEGRPKIVDGIPGNDGNLYADGFHLWMTVFNRLASGLRVSLNCGDVTICQSADDFSNIRDVLIGPFNL